MFNLGDIVQVGKGKVEYAVSFNEVEGVTTIESLTSGKSQTVNTERLTLLRPAEEEPMNASVEAIEAFLPIGFSVGQIEDMESNTVPFPLPKWEIELVSEDKRPYVLQVDGVVSSFKTFDSAAFAMTRTPRIGYAAIDYRGRRLVERAS